MSKPTWKAVFKSGYNKLKDLLTHNTTEFKYTKGGESIALNKAYSLAKPCKCEAL